MGTTPITELVENSKSIEDGVVNSEEGRPAWCELCKVSCGSKVSCSSNVLSRHISGKQHLKNLKKSEKIPGLPSTPIASVTRPPIAEPIQNPKSTKGEIVKSEEGKPAWCELWKASCSTNVLGRHLSGKKHLENIQTSENLPGLPSTPIASVATPPGTGPVEKPTSTKGEIVSSEEGMPAWCELCKARYSSDVLSRYLSGKKHLKNLQKSQKTLGSPSTSIASVTTLPPVPVENPENPKSSKGTVVNSKEGKPAWCELCGIGCGTHDALNNHISGKKHQKKLKKSENLIGPGSLQDPLNEEGKVFILESCKRKAKSSVTTLPPVLDENPENPKLTKGEVVNSKEGKPAWCELCGIGCGTLDVLNKHISGKKHQKKLKKSENLIGPGSLQDPLNEEGKVFILESCKRKAKCSVTTLPSVLVENPKPTKGKVVNSKEGKSAWCELCGIGCGTHDMLNEHISGKKHQKKSKKSDNRIGPGSLQGPLNEEGKVFILESCKRKAKSSVAIHGDLDTKRQKMIKEGAASGSSMICTLCNVVCNSPIVFTSHIAGQKHTAMALKHVKAGSNDEI